MTLEVLVDRLEDLNYALGGFRSSNYYIENKENEIKIGVYARRSKGDKKAIDNQITSIRYIVKDEFGLEYDEEKIYIDNGVSGTNNDRSAYLNLKRDLLQKRINTVVVANIDRLGRTTEVLLSDVFPNQEIQYLFISLDNKLINGLKNRSLILKKAEQADSYAAECSEKARRGLKGRMKRGSVISAKAPYGYEIIQSGDVRKFVLGNIIEVDTVKKIFDMYLYGKSMAEIAKYLSEENIKTPSGKEIWGKSTIESILKNPTYAGTLYQGRYEKQGYSNSGDSKGIVKVNKNEWIYGGVFDAIIDKATFDMVSEKLDENKSVRKKGEDTKLFTSLLKCGECGRALTFRKKSNSYQCSGSLRKPYNCSSHLISEEELKELINIKIKNIIDTSIDSNIIESVINKIEQDNSNKSLENQIKHNEEEINKCVKQIVENQRINSRYLDMIINEIEDDINKLKVNNEHILSRIEDNNKQSQEMKEILNNISKYDIDSNKIYRLFIKQINVFEEEKIEILWRY